MGKRHFRKTLSINLYMRGNVKLSGDLFAGSWDREQISSIGKVDKWDSTCALINRKWTDSFPGAITSEVNILKEMIQVPAGLDYSLNVASETTTWVDQQLHCLINKTRAVKRMVVGAAELCRAVLYCTSFPLIFWDAESAEMNVRFIDAANWENSSNGSMGSLLPSSSFFLLLQAASRSPTLFASQDRLDWKVASKRRAQYVGDLFWRRTHIHHNCTDFSNRGATFSSKPRSWIGLSWRYFDQFIYLSSQKKKSKKIETTIRLIHTFYRYDKIKTITLDVVWGG
ncbi:hypothetical protein GQR58_013090 [Nymphon striatum]|nr:hypothetical protein GQR58_013090 [Nymphon striatum]